MEQLDKTLLYQTILNKDLTYLTEILPSFNNEIDQPAYHYFFNLSAFNYEDFPFLFFIINHPSFQNNDEMILEEFYKKLFNDIYHDSLLFDLFVNSSLYNEKQFTEQFFSFTEHNKLFNIHANNYLKLINKYNIPLLTDDLMLIIKQDRIDILKVLFENNFLTFVNNDKNWEKQLISFSLNSCSIHCFQYLLDKYPRKIHMNDIFTETYTIDLFAKTYANKFFSYAINNFEWDKKFISEFLPALINGNVKNNYIEFTDLIFKQNNEEYIELIFHYSSLAENNFFIQFFNKEILPKILEKRAFNLNEKLEKKLDTKQNLKSKI